ncbi:hypothetical protein D9M71_505870 [compost metagenome]
MVERADGVGAEGAETHGRDVEDRGGVGLGALRSAHHHTEAGRVAERRRAHGVADEFVAGRVDVDQGAEGFVAALVLGSCVDQRALGAGERQAVVVGLQQVLADLRADAFHQVADVAEDRVVAPHRMGRLQQVEETQQAEHPGDQGEGPDPLVVGEGQADKREQHAEGEEGVAAQQ